MSDYEYIPMNPQDHDLSVYFEMQERNLLVNPDKHRPPLRVEVTRSPWGRGAIVTFYHEHYATSYEPSRPSYDRLANLANSGAYVVEILDSGYGVGWTMRRKVTQ